MIFVSGHKKHLLINFDQRGNLGQDTPVFPKFKSYVRAPSHFAVCPGTLAYHTLSYAAP